MVPKSQLDPTRADDALGGLQVIEAKITAPTNERALSVLIGTKVAQEGTQDTPDAQTYEDDKERHKAVIHVINKVTDGVSIWTRPTPAIDLVHDGVGRSGYMQIDLQVYRGDVVSWGHGIHAELGSVDAEGDIHIELGSPGWKENTIDDKSAIVSKAKTTITARSANPADVAPGDVDYEKQGVGVYALNAGKGEVRVLARYVDIVADMEGIRVDTTTVATKGVLIEIGHPGSNPVVHRE